MILTFLLKVHLVSEHVWCEDYLVRSVYLKNTRTGETRTVTQFHFRSWPAHGVPSSTKVVIVKTMSYEDLGVIFQILQICLLIFCQKTDEKSDRNANSYNLIN